MKTLSIISMVVLLLFASVNISAQCCSKASHQHDQKASESKANAIMNDQGKQEATIVIKDGYSPNTIIVKKGIPVQLKFDLQEKSCTGTVVFKDLDIKQKLTPFKTTTVEFTPSATGSFTFACPMEMFKGTLVVKD